MKKVFLHFLPWIITAAALYLAFAGVDWRDLFSHIKACNPFWIISAVTLTCISYLARAYRWKFFFPTKRLSYPEATKILFLGFFMNNILPARAGELVRAHVGAKLSGERRTLLLATIASERLVDGLTISLMFVGFALGLGDPTMSAELLYVAFAFGGAALAVLVTLAWRKYLFTLAQRLSARINHKASNYASKG